MRLIIVESACSNRPRCNIVRLGIIVQDINLVGSITRGYGINLNHLAVFQAVVEAGGITAGAERLRISQPAASKQIKELETALRVALFDRVGRGVRLTEPGRVLAGYARRLFVLESEAEQAVRELRAVERGSLAVGASTTIGSFLLPDVLARFHRKHPGVRVHVEIGNTERIHRDLLDHRLDVGLTEGLVSAPELASDVFAEDELVGIAPPDHPILKQKKVRAKDFVALPFVLREPGSGTRDVVEISLTKVGLRVSAVMSLGSTEAIKRVVALGVGVAIVSRLSVLSEQAAGKLAVVALADLKIPRPLHRVRLRSLGESPALEAFNRVVSETLPMAPRS